MDGEQLHLERTWVKGERIGGGGFGQVYEARSGDQHAAAKFVPQAPGADRELLFVNLENVRNVVPVIDRGAHDGYWVLVMPRAELSLQEFVDQTGDALKPEDTVDVLKDVCDALVDLERRIVHRDLKPANILRLNGRWCLSDFGISRFAESTTAPDTQKHALSPPYAAPERWRSERATSATDIYALGIIAYQLLRGSRPFEGLSLEDYRDQHLHDIPPPLEDVPRALAVLIDECLFKAPQARPTPSNLRARLDRVVIHPRLGGLGQLQEANRDEVHRRREVSRQESEAQTDAERQEDLIAAGQQSFERMCDEVLEAITDAAPAGSVSRGRRAGWSVRLHEAALTMYMANGHRAWGWGGWRAPVFEVLLVASIDLRIPPDGSGYAGRSHSLWYGDIQELGRYNWFETAFMMSPLVGGRGEQNPSSLDPGEAAAKAVGPGLAEFQLAWPFTPVAVDELNEFIDRWAGWLAAAAQGRLQHPSSMPERPAEGSWRRS